MTLYEIFKYKPEEILEIAILLDQVQKLGIEDRTQETLFQFSPRLLEPKHQIEGFGEHETWYTFHKHTIVNEIIFFLIEETIQGDYAQEDAINLQIWKEFYLDFFDNDLSVLSKEEIINLFKVQYEIV